MDPEETRNLSYTTGGLLGVACRVRRCQGASAANRVALSVSRLGPVWHVRTHSGRWRSLPDLASQVWGKDNDNDNK